MFRIFLKSKIHMAKVTSKRLDYEGSITIDENLARKAGLLPDEKVLVADATNGNRFETYVIYGEKGELCVNGAAAHLVEVGDRVIIMSFRCGILHRNPRIVRVDEENNIIK